MNENDDKKEIIEIKLEDLATDETKVIKIERKRDLEVKGIIFNENLINTMHVTKKHISFVVNDIFMVKLYSQNEFVCLMSFHGSIVFEKTKNKNNIYEKRAK